MGKPIIVVSPKWKISNIIFHMDGSPECNVGMIYGNDTKWILALLIGSIYSTTMEFIVNLVIVS